MRNHRLALFLVVTGTSVAPCFGFTPRSLSLENPAEGCVLEVIEASRGLVLSLASQRTPAAADRLNQLLQTAPLVFPPSQEMLQQQFSWTYVPPPHYSLARELGFSVEERLVGQFHKKIMGLVPSLVTKKQQSFRGIRARLLTLLVTPSEYRTKGNILSTIRIQGTDAVMRQQQLAYQQLMIDFGLPNTPNAKLANTLLFARGKSPEALTVIGTLPENGDHVTEDSLREFILSKNALGPDALEMSDFRSYQSLNTTPFVFAVDVRLKN
jgi:hypothetical protein